MPKILDERDIPILLREIGISGEASGSSINLNDATEYPFSNVISHGKSTQETTTGAQLIPFPFFDGSTTVNGVKCVQNDDGSLTVSGTSTAGVNYYFARNMTLKAGTYTLSDSGNMVGGRLNIYDFTENVLIAAITDGETSVTFTTDKDYSNVGIYINTAYEGKAFSGTTYPMLNVGDTAKLHEIYSGGKPAPNIDYPREIVSTDNPNLFVCGKNFATTNRNTKITGNGIEVTRSFDSSEVTINGTSNLLHSAAVMADILLPAGTYTASIYGLNVIDTGVDRAYVMDATKKKVIVNYIQPNRPQTFTVEKPTLVNIDVVMALNSTYNNQVVKIQIEKGESATEYEPYKKQSLAIPYTLYGIPVSSGGNYTDENGQEWICDEVDFEKGIYIKRIHTIELPATFKRTNAEDKEMQLAISSNAYYAGANSNILQCYCSHFPAVPRQEIYRNSKVDGYCGIAVSNNYIRIVDNINFNADSDALNAWIEEQANIGNPVIFKYVLKTPVEVALTAEEKSIIESINTYKGITNVFSDDIGNFTVKYIADIKAYLDNKFTALTSD